MRNSVRANRRLPMLRRTMLVSHFPRILRDLRIRSETLERQHPVLRRKILPKGRIPLSHRITAMVRLYPAMVPRRQQAMRPKVTELRLRRMARRAKRLRWKTGRRPFSRRLTRPRRA